MQKKTSVFRTIYTQSNAHDTHHVHISTTMAGAIFHHITILPSFACLHVYTPKTTYPPPLPLFFAIASSALPRTQLADLLPSSSSLFLPARLACSLLQLATWSNVPGVHF